MDKIPSGVCRQVTSQLLISVLKFIPVWLILITARVFLYGRQAFAARLNQSVAIAMDLLLTMSLAPLTQLYWPWKIWVRLKFSIIAGSG